MSWTPDRVDSLKKMWSDGQSASQIANDLGGVTRNAVIGKIHRLGLSNRGTVTSKDKQTNTNIEKDIFLSILGFSVDFIESFGFPKKIIDLYFIFNEFITKFISLEMQDKSILNFLNSLDAFRRPERLKAFLIQAQYFLDFHKMKEGEKINIFIKINNIIENKIDYGNLTNKNVEDIKRNIENINLNIINSILLNKKY